MAKLNLDDKTVKALEPPGRGNRIDYDVPRGPRDTDFVRGFAVRTTAAGRKTFVLVYVTAEGRERRQTIGDFGPFTVTTARDAARALRIKVQDGGDPFAEQKRRRADAQAKAARANATLGGMLDAYVLLLERAKKASAAKVKGEIHRTIKEPFPALWKKPAADVDLDDLVRVTNRLVRSGKWRQAEKTRAYLRSAYTACAAARGSSGSADLFAGYEHVQNIARDLATIDRPAVDRTATEEAEKRALSVVELAAYWRHVAAMEGPHGAMLRLHLLTGAQRAEQLARLTAQDFDRDAKTITLWDAKGRRKAARPHVVPLLPEALAALDLMRGDRGAFLFTLDGGEHGAGYHTLRGLVRDVADRMVEAGETGSTFTPGELRITVETRLAALKVPRETRAQLQSHGLGGVQGKHYDKHDYIEEKRDALRKLRALIEGKAAKVTPIQSAKRSRATG